jgi:hypothetical protein
MSVSSAWLASAAAATWSDDSLRPHGGSRAEDEQSCWKTLDDMHLEPGDDALALQRRLKEARKQRRIEEGTSASSTLKAQWREEKPPEQATAAAVAARPRVVFGMAKKRVAKVSKAIAPVQTIEGRLQRADAEAGTHTLAPNILLQALARLVVVCDIPSAVASKVSAEKLQLCLQLEVSAASAVRPLQHRWLASSGPVRRGSEGAQANPLVPGCPPLQRALELTFGSAAAALGFLQHWPSEGGGRAQLSLSTGHVVAAYACTRPLLPRCCALSLLAAPVTTAGI